MAGLWRTLQLVAGGVVDRRPSTERTKIPPMDAVYREIRKIARDIAGRYPQPDFYRAHTVEIRTSRNALRSDPFVCRLRKQVAEDLDDNAGHGIGHMEKVAVDAGALVIVEGRLAGEDEATIRRRLFLVQCAGLLHDICRKERSHAQKGADTARGLLKFYPLHPNEIDSICTAIHNHEAFTGQKAIVDGQTRALSDCLYDADKFRWGPDNFTHTVWDMVEMLTPPLKVFMARYPSGMASLRKIRSTFRSRTGRKFGPQFIDMGIRIGEELYVVLRSDFLQNR